MNSGSVRFATPSPQRTFTSYLLPVSRRTRPPIKNCETRQNASKINTVHEKQK